MRLGLWGGEREAWQAALEIVVFTAVYAGATYAGIAGFLKALTGAHAEEAKALLGGLLPAKGKEEPLTVWNVSAAWMPFALMSLFLMLTSQARDTLRGVETLILDEVHAIAGAKRGSHLAISVERLQSLAAPLLVSSRAERTDVERVGG